MIPALSIRAPWAWLILNGKDIENRDWNTGYRGRFQIHATGTDIKAEYESAQRLIESAQIEIQLPPVQDLVTGAIIGTVFLDRISPPNLVEWGDPALQSYFYRWGNPKAKFWWHLCRPQAWTPDECKSCGGKLGWFYPL